MPAPRTGFDFKLYYNTGTHASPTWSLIGEIGDLSLPDLQRTLAQVLLRNSRWKRNVPSSIDASIQFALLYNPDTTIFDALRAAFFAGTCIEFFVADGLAATAGSEGLRIGCVIERFPINQNLESVAMVDQVVLKPGWFEETSVLIEPDWYEVAGP